MSSCYFTLNAFQGCEAKKTENSKNKGGALSIRTVSNGYINLTDCYFIGCKADNNGGAAYFDTSNGRVDLQGVKCEGCHATELAGGIYLKNARGNIRTLDVSRCSALTGAALVVNNPTGDLLFYDSLFYQNTAFPSNYSSLPVAYAGYGAGITFLSYNHNINFVSCGFVENIAEHAAALYLPSVSPRATEESCSLSFLHTRFVGDKIYSASPVATEIVIDAELPKIDNYTFVNTTTTNKYRLIAQGGRDVSAAFPSDGTTASNSTKIYDYSSASTNHPVLGIVIIIILSVIGMAVGCWPSLCCMIAYKHRLFIFKNVAR